MLEGDELDESNTHQTEEEKQRLEEERKKKEEMEKRRLEEETKMIKDLEYQRNQDAKTKKTQKNLDSKKNEVMNFFE